MLDIAPIAAGLELRAKGGKVSLKESSLEIGSQVMDRAGEFEVGGIEVECLSLNGSLIFHIFVEDLILLYLPELKNSLSEKQSETVDDATIVIAPTDKEKVSGKHFLDLIQAINPKLVVSFGEDLQAELSGLPYRKTSQITKISNQTLLEKTDYYHLS